VSAASPRAVERVDHAEQVALAVEVHGHEVRDAPTPSLAGSTRRRACPKTVDRAIFAAMTLQRRLPAGLSGSLGALAGVLVAGR
jgi:hypothetical protein